VFGMIPQRRRLGAIGSVLAVTGVLVIGFTALGGAGYASSAVRAVAKTISNRGTGTGPHGRSVQSADQAQYSGEKPAVSPPPSKHRVKSEGATKKLSAPPRSHGLPFTGMSLLVPALLGFGLVGGGLALRRGARRDPVD